MADRLPRREPSAVVELRWCRLPNPDVWLERCARAFQWQRESIRLFGKQQSVPREVAWMGTAGLNYRYSQTDHPANGWSDAVLPLRDWLADRYPGRFNFVLANRYLDGQDSMGWHSDDEAELHGDVVSVSLGATRRFLLDAPDGRCALELGHGDVIQIPRAWRHALPKTRTRVGMRINLTFRELLGS
ncbi:MAG: alpha-ketoglutarate-dependent dioxygenase AlkB [Pseudomonadota bacterium]